jgi:hypothetical protein
MMEDMRRQAEEEAAGSVNMKQVEDDAIEALIRPRNLRIKQVRSQLLTKTVFRNIFN